MKKTLLVVLLAVFAFVMFAESASAIPAFARKYRMSCSTCHYPFPRLKAYGDDFAANGFVLEDQESPRYYVDTGDEDLSLVRELPIAMRIDTWMFYEEASEAVDFKMPWTFKLLSGGSLSDHVSYYFYFYFDERGEVAGLDDAFVIFNNILTDQDLDVYVGQFSISDPMMKAELRLTFENYMAYRMMPGSSNMRTSYDRGLMVTYGAPWGSTGLTGMIVNGNGLADFDNGFADNDDKKVFAAHLSQDVGDMLNLGGFVMMGTETLQDNTIPIANMTDNEVSVFGVNGTFEMGPLQVNGQYLMRTDSNPYILATEREVTMNGIIAEAIYWPNGDDSKYFLAALYNNVTFDAEDSAPAAFSTMLEDMTYQTVTGHIGHMARRNVRIGLEGTYDMELEQFKAGIGVVMAW